MQQPSDPAVKQILLLMNEKESFIIEDLDEYHLVIKAEQEYRVRKELETEVRNSNFGLKLTIHLCTQLEKNTYSLET
jgi:TFIIH basal transcription factor complex TTD-A subunit